MSRSSWDSGRVVVTRSALLAVGLIAARPYVAACRAQLPAAPALASPRVDSLRLSLTESVDIALQQATTVQVAREEEHVAAARVLAAYGRFLPALGAGASAYGEQGTALLSQTTLAPYDASFHGASVGLSTGITLFDGLRDRAGLRAAIARREAAGLTIARAREEIVDDVTDAYYRVLLDDRLTAVAQANLDLSRQRLAQLTEQVHAGVKAPPDLYRQEARAREDEAAVIAAQTRGSADRIGLLRRLRLDPTHPLVLTPAAVDTTPAPSAPAAAPTPPMPSATTSDTTMSILDVAALSRRALAQRPDLAASADEVRAAEAGVVQARAGRLPRATLEFDVVDAARLFDRQEQNGIDLLGAKSAPIQLPLSSQLRHQVAGVLTLGISVPIFDQWQTRADVERAQAAAERSRLLEEDLRDRVVGEVAQAVDEARSAEQAMKAATAQVAAAQKAYDAVSGRYDVGMASFIDVATAQTDLTRARSNVEAAIVNRALARQHLVTALGDAPATPDQPATGGRPVQGLRR
ncbi:MAG TPA: TolC family protein [Gemmatimonadaceae bacterium]